MGGRPDHWRIFISTLISTYWVPEAAPPSTNHVTIKNVYRYSLVAQWSRICLPIHETQVRSMIWEDPK